jgi:L-ascorbate metabolism protein UlaG (beta-lactamase superfamily)
MIKLHFLGHCCFLLHGDDGAKILIDPVDPSLGYGYPNVAVDLVLVSRAHMAHNAISLLKGSPAVFMGAGERRVGRIHILGIAASGEKPELNTIFVWRYQGLRFCHLGALRGRLDASLKDLIGPEVDILFLPVGGNEYVSPEVATQVMHDIAPKLTIPMGFRVPHKNLELLPLSEFLNKNSVPVIEPQDSYDLDFRAIKAMASSSVLKLPVMEQY